MKKLFIILLLLSFTVPAMSHNPKSKKMGQQSYLPFAQKGKYGKLRTKQCKLVKQKEAWIFKQWGRN